MNAVSWISTLSASGGGGELNLGEFLIHHLADSQEWHPLPGIPGIHLPEFLSLHILMLVIGACLTLLTFGFLYKKSPNAPSGLTSLLEVLVVFVRDDIVYKFIGKKDGEKYAHWFLTFFFFILGMNLMGLVPVFSTATANVSVTAGLALITLTMMIVLGIAYNGIGGFCKHFMPSGVPVPILFIIAPIEFVGMFIKPFALTMRLFANMMAGHMVLFSLIALLVLFSPIVSFPAIGMSLFVYTLELAVAFIQAYVFTLLSAMFVGDMMHPHH